jgi:hypothetical protein
MSLPHLIDRATPQDETFRATFETREQGQHTNNTLSKTSTHHIIDTTCASSTIVVILREDYG